MRPLVVFVLAALFVAGCSTPTEPPSPPPAATPGPALEPTPTVESAPPTRADTPVPLPPPEAISFPDPHAYAWAPAVSGLYLPVDIQNAGDGSGRLFVVERPGRIRIVSDGSLFQQPFLDITDRIRSNGSEQGLLGLAFHPDYGT